VKLARYRKTKEYLLLYVTTDLIHIQALMIMTKWCFQETLVLAFPEWKNPSRAHGYKWGLLKVRKGNTKGAWWGPLAESAFPFQVLLKPTLTHEVGRPRGFPPNNEQVGRDMGDSQPGEGGLGHPWATYMSLKLFLLLVCLIIICIYKYIQNMFPKLGLLDETRGGGKEEKNDRK
jgi:hypothetical protein